MTFLRKILKIQSYYCVLALSESLNFSICWFLYFFVFYFLFSIQDWKIIFLLTVITKCWFLYLLHGNINSKCFMVVFWCLNELITLINRFIIDEPHCIKRWMDMWRRSCLQVWSSSKLISEPKRKPLPKVSRHSEL